MKKLVTLALLVLMSIGLFIVAASVIHRPLVVGEIQRMLEFKLAAARALPSPKIVVIAGSNGRYSHRCDQLEAALHMPCINASIGVGLGLDFLLDQWRPLLKPGDLVYMPLEYSQYRFSRAEMDGGLQNALLVQSHRGYLWRQGWQRIAAAYGSFDLSFMLQGLAEMGLQSRGFKRRTSTDTLTPQGDEAGHTESVAASYAWAVRQMTVDEPRVPASSAAIDVLRAFLRDAARSGVMVVGGLPTVPDSAEVPRDTVAALTQLYRAEGHRFITLENMSRYPLTCFFDSTYHLHETCQKTHSRSLGHRLAQELDRDGR